MFCRSLFALLYLFFLPLCYLFFLDIRILITPLVFSNSSNIKWIYSTSQTSLGSIVTSSSLSTQVYYDFVGFCTVHSCGRSKLGSSTKIQFREYSCRLEYSYIGCAQECFPMTWNSHHSNNYWIVESTSQKKCFIKLFWPWSHSMLGNIFHRIDWLIDCCLAPIQQFFSNIMARTSYILMIWWWSPLCFRPTCLFIYL